MTDTLLLKWGTLKGWNLQKKENQAIMERYLSLGATASAMAQRDTPEQKQLICDLIDAVDGEIMNDWSGKAMSKDEAKNYVQEYRR